MTRPWLLAALAPAFLAAAPAAPASAAAPAGEAGRTSLPRLTDGDLVRLAAAPFDKRRMMFRRSVLGRHRGLVVVADHPCGDVCPAATRRIVHYDLAPERCARSGGVVVEELLPGIAPTRRPFCLPAVLARRQ